MWTKGSKPNIELAWTEGPQTNIELYRMLLSWRTRFLGYLGAWPRSVLIYCFPKALRRVLPENPLNTDTSTLTLRHSHLHTHTHTGRAKASKCEVCQCQSMQV